MNNYCIDQLINIQQVEQLLESHVSISGIPCGLMDNDLNIIIGAGLQQVCTQFLWEKPESFSRCWRNDPEIRQALDRFNGDPFECRCKNGMINIAIPIIIDGKRLAIFFSSQFFYDDAPPDLGWFRRQAEELGFDPEAYLAAVSQAPLLSRTHVDNTLRFLHQLVQMLAETGYTNLQREREQEERKQIEREHVVFVSAINNAIDAFFLIDAQHRFQYVNDAACDSLGYSREELLTMGTLEINPDMSPEKLEALKNSADTHGILKPFETRHRTKDGRIFPVEISSTPFWFDGARLGLFMARDITQRKQTEQQLNLLGFALDQVREAVFLKNLKEGRFLYVNQEACRSLEYSRDELTCMSALDIDPDFSPELLQDNITKLLKHGAMTFETRHRSKSGKHYPVEVSSTLFEYDGAQYSFALVRDITQRKQTEQQIKLLNLALDNVHEGAFLIDLQGRFLHVNREACRSLGYTKNELCGMGVLDINPDYSSDMLAELIADELKQGTLTFETRHRTRDGQVFPVEISSSVFADGDSSYLLSLVRDITERKQVEEALQEREQQFRTLAENLPDNIVRYDNYCRIRYINPQLERTLGKSAISIIGKTPVESSGELFQEYQHKVSQVLTTGENAEIDLIIPDIEKGKRLHEIRFIAERGADGNVSGVLAIGRDITERKQAEHKLREKQQHLSDMALELTLSEERERRRIAVDLHDTLGQDLTLTRMKLGGLNKTDLSIEQSKLLHEIKGLTEAAINRVRSLTKLLCPPVLESAGLEAALKWLARQLVADYGLQIVFNDDLQEKTVARELQMELYTSVRELLINVAKHAGTSTACLSVCREADTLAIRVEDDGVGFDVDTVLNSPSTDGFGLFTIRRRIKYLGGVFQITSKPGSGTEVVINMPLAKKAPPVTTTGEQS